MGMTVAEYRNQLQMLLPPGAAWTREAEADLTGLLEALAAELARVDQRGQDLLDEADPRTTSELLTDWERLAGLPDPCSGPLATIRERRDALLAKITGMGGQSRAYFIALAESLGYTIQIREYFPFVAGRSVGNNLANGDVWRHTWQVDAPAVTSKHFTIGSAAGEPLRVWGNSLLEFAIGRRKPAHTMVLFAYYLPGGDVAVGYAGTILLHKDTAPLVSQETRVKELTVYAVSGIAGDIYADKTCLMKISTSPDGSLFGTPEQVLISAGDTVRFEYPRLYCQAVKIEVVNGGEAMGEFRLFVRGGA
jgi:uncharacterized protein YmfQ (DUF2313 family)